MSKRQPYAPPKAPKNALPIWRSLAEKAEPGRRAERAVQEEAVQTIEGGSLLTRRGFMVVGGATATAVGLAGCIRRPAENILPHTRAPEYALPGIALHYATTMEINGAPMGVLVESHEGRPTKIEGNREHPESRGSTDAFTQAEVLRLYDESRTGTLYRRDGDDRAQVTWADLDEALAARLEGLEGGRGQGLRFLSEPTCSPTFLRARAALLERFPEARFHTYTSNSQSRLRKGLQTAFGQKVSPLYDFGRARRILALDCDFLGTESGSVRNARTFAEGRRLRSAADVERMSRLYVVEGNLSLTGMNADERLRIPSRDVERYLKAFAKRLAAEEGVELAPAIVEAIGDPSTEGIPAAWIEKVVEDMASSQGRALIVVGSRQPARVHALGAALNMALNAVRRTVAYFEPIDADEEDHLESITSLVEDMRGGSVSTLVILGGNPVYDAPADLDFGGALEGMSGDKISLHLSLSDDETSEKCTWRVPMAHPLESWGDHITADGTISVQQPLIAPLHGGRTAAEIVGMMAGMRSWRAYHMVRRTVRATDFGARFERIWRRALHRGTVPGGTPRLVSPTLQDADIAQALGEAEAGAALGANNVEVVFTPSYQVLDGRYANVPWLLEMPDPVTKIVWDNAAILSPATARGLSVTEGDVLRLSKGDKSIEIAAAILPGQADWSVQLPLGWGRAKGGPHSQGAGADVGGLRTAEGFFFADGVTVQKANRTYELARTQEHHSMEGRPLAIDATVADYQATPDFAQWREPEPPVGPLWSQVDYSTPNPGAQGGRTYRPWPEQRPAAEDAPARYAWGMVIDLTTCTGCSACIVACDSENNVAKVGKFEVARGREMHWMRLDRYFVGDDEDNPKVALQPVACQHCEEAPCENVCPVNATTHSAEGLNDMAYNRCIGTRYCANNCPYKVRRFNFLDFWGYRNLPEIRRMQFNPNVTVRMRGVIEKCSYCVQRIQSAKITARREGRRVRDGEITPACASACPAQAITFGDLNDSRSRVARLAETDRGYRLLANVGVQPRTRYLGKIRNSNPEMS